jgi:hypothetical protein
VVFGGVAHLPKIRFVVDGIPVPVEQKFNKITAAEVAFRRPLLLQILVLAVRAFI